MERPEQLLRYISAGVDDLLAAGRFAGGQPLRKTQRQALEAYQRYLSSSDLNTQEKLKGFFELPTGVGKTAVFIAIVAAAHKAADHDGQPLKSAIVVPTTTLLAQTLLAIEGTHDIVGFAPDLKGQIGLYGDGEKDLTRPLTIMTYDAWVALSEDGEIGSHNIDILISDEAHRGTSERRLENKSDAFDERTAQIAFTATAHFDEEKSVQVSHEREIFYKSIRDAILEDELASYVQSQRAVIRVAPTAFMLTEEYNEASREEKTEYRKRIRQRAWNDFALRSYREGVDERTGDLLSDNQAAFFVEDIRHADDLEALLNADEVMARRAQARGCDGVAVAIHSKLSPNEQRERMKAYTAGRYLAVIGDDKFKEGFDHPQLKTVFDCPHASLVDKAQILGRGARKWWNERKGRFEGLIFIDTVIYVGSDDPKANESLRAAALRRAMAAKDILEESFVIGPAAPPRSQPNSTSGSSVNASLFVGDDDIEYYGSIEDITVLESEIARLRKDDWVEITPEMRALINSEIDRTGIGSKNILTGDFPDGLTFGKIECWRSGQVKNAEPEYWSWLLNEFSRHADILRLTDEMRTLLVSHIHRTGVGAIKLLLREDAPTTLSAKTVDSWRSPNVKKVRARDWKWVLGAYDAIADEPRVTIDDKMRAELNAEAARTGVGPKALLDTANAPSDLTFSMVNTWRSGEVKSAKAAHWNLVRQLYAATDEKIPLTETMHKKLLAEMGRTLRSSTSILKHPDRPNGLSTSQIETWKNGSVRSVNRSHWDWVVARLQDMPDRIEISENMILHLKSEELRTGVNAGQMLKLADCPESLTRVEIKNWKARKTVSTNTSIWNWVMNTYAAMPDRATPENDPSPL